MKINQSKLHTFARLVQIASRSHHSNTSKPPTEEELTALLEAKLSKTRSNQIYAYLNNDATLFSQWILLVEEKASRDAQIELQQQAHYPNKKSFFSRLGEAFLPKVYIPSSGLAFCFLLWFGLTYYPNMSSDNDKVLSFSSVDYSRLSNTQLDEKYNEILGYVAQKCSTKTSSNAHNEQALYLLKSYQAELEKRSLEVPRDIEKSIFEIETNKLSICEILRQ